MDYEQVKMALAILNMLVSAAVWLFVWMNKRQQASIESIEKLEAQTKEAIDKLDNHVNQRFQDKCKRLNTLEAQVSSMPTKADIIRIHERLDDMGKDSHSMILMLGEISGQVKQINKER